MLIGIAIPTYRHLRVFGVLETGTIVVEIPIRNHVVLVEIIESVVTGVDIVGYLHLRVFGIVLYFASCHGSCMLVFQYRFLGNRDDICQYIRIKVLQRYAIYLYTCERVLRECVQVWRDGIDYICLSRVVCFYPNGRWSRYTSIDDSHYLLWVLLDDCELNICSTIWQYDLVVCTCG